MIKQRTNRRYLPGEKVIHNGEQAEVIDTYASGSVMIRIGSETHEAVQPGERQMCGPDGGAHRGEEVRFG